MSAPAGSAVTADAADGTVVGTTVWDAIARRLERHGTTVFGLPGDDMDALAGLDRTGVPVVLTDEQRTACFQAAGHHAVTGRTPTVVAGRGPGAAALVPGVLEAASGSVPLVVLVAGAPLDSDPIATFQSAPVEAMLSPVAKAFRRLAGPRRVDAEIDRAFLLAASPPLGPVVLEVPDGLVAPGRPVPSVVPVPVEPAAVTGGARVSPATAALLQRARHPLVLVGSGAAGTDPAVLVALAGALGAGLLCTASGRGILGEDTGAFLGLGGLYLHPAARRLVADADLVVALGSRLEETVTEHLGATVEILQVNADPADLSVDRPGVLLPARCETAVPALLAAVRDRRPDPAWTDRVHRAARDGWRWARQVVADPSAPLPAAVLRDLADRLPPGTVVTHENGAADMWSYLFPVFSLPPGGISIAPSEQTTLGFGTAAAAGARRGDPERLVVSIGGDGAFGRMAHDRACTGPAAPAVLYVVLDNSGFGWLETMARRRTGHRGRFAGGGRGVVVPPGVAHAVVRDRRGARDALRTLLAVVAGGEPAVLVVVCGQDEGAPVLDDEG